MPERWETEVRKLRTLAPPETVPKPRRRESSVPGPSGRQRAIALSVSFAVFAGAAFFAWYAFGSGRDIPAVDHSYSTAEGPLPPASVRIRCDTEGTHIDTPVVRPQPDGVHLLLRRGRHGVRHVVVRTAAGAETVGLDRVNTYRIPRSGHKVVRLLAGPGQLEVLCSPTNEILYKRVDVQDPDGLWGSPDLACSRSGRNRFDVHGFTAIGPKLSSPADVRSNLAGLRSSDDVRWAGYPAAQWIWKAGPWFVVVRDGESIGSIWFWQVDGAATINTCPGSGITRPGHPWNES